jgi:ubiquinone/menaquinone biosynthesis C-methylase UbiE/DNA-binding transcriptional ArsR family regulator
MYSWMSAVAEPLRARMLRLVERHELNVGELAQVLHLPQSTTSRHLKVLSDDGWLSSRRDGTSRLYRLALDRVPPPQAALWEVLSMTLQQDPNTETDAARLEQVLHERKSQSHTFFASAAGRWDKLRDDLFGSSLELSLIPALLPRGLVFADLGCGTGRLSGLIAPFAQKVYAVDSSDAMIAAARTFLATHSNVEFCSGQLESLPLAAASCDAAWLCLVLHYVPDPALVLCEAARALRPKGRLVIVDMLPHHREEYRQEMGHIWLGFDNGQLETWLRAAGFDSLHFSTLAADPLAKGPPLFLCVAELPDRESSSLRRS